MHHVCTSYPPRNVVTFLAALTPREYEALQRSCHTPYCPGIAGQMNITPGAVYKLRKEVMSKAADEGLKEGERQAAFRRLLSTVEPYLRPL